MAFSLSNVPLAPDEHRRQTEGDVLRSLVDALIAEDLFGFRSRGRIGSVAGALYLPLEGDERHVQVGLGQDAVVFRARPAVALQPYRLSRPPVLLLGADGGGPVPLNPRELLDLVVSRLAESRAPNLDEVLDGLELAVIHGAVLLEEDGRWGRVRSAARPTALDWEALTAVGDRPFHPTGRARHGWDRARYRRYSAVGDGPVALDWVAVRADHLESGSVERLADALALAHATRLPEGERPESPPLPDRPPSPADALLSADERLLLESAVAEAGVDGSDHVVLPVHPWQRAHVLPDVFSAEWRSGVCVPVASGLGAFWPTASTRTMAPAGGTSPAAVHVKLPVGITTLGALRLLPPRYLANGARAQRLLESAAERHPALQNRLSVCDEQAWWAFAVPGGDGAYDDKPGHLGCLLRVWPDPDTTCSGSGSHRGLVPLGALGVVLPDGSAPGLTRLIAERGHDPADPAAALDVFDDVASVVSEVALACFGLGFMPELHGQNAVLACEGGRVAG
ncbi:MAG TPA: IucA/IucC family protein, partial [Acidimicrobiia bacterium]|nr:IucA/IucC family protein [Acidimicrobiia bacterium]